MAGTSRDLDWRQSSKECDSGNCLEMLETPEGVVVRQSDRPAGPFLNFSKRDWTEFLQRVRRGEFDSRP